MNLGIDLDGVCYDFVTALRKYAFNSGEVGSLDDVPPAESWNFFKNQWGWTTERYLKVFGQGVIDRDIFWMGDPYPGCKDALTHLREHGHRIVIVTHRDHPSPHVAELMKQATVRWLAAWEIPYDSLMFEGSKTGLPVDLMLDDAPHNIAAAVEVGERAVIFDQAWNRDCDVPGKTHRVSGWTDFIELVGVLDAETTVPQIIGLSGYAQSGKDTVGAMLRKDAGFERLAFADALRDMLYALNPDIVGRVTDRAHEDRYGLRSVKEVVDTSGWEWAKANTDVRRLLQRLGTEAGRQILGDDIWVRTAMAKVKPGGRYVFTDVRFPNEAKTIKNVGGQVWRIDRGGTSPVNAHPSETALDDWPFDVVIHNDFSLEALAKHVEIALLSGQV